MEELLEFLQVDLEKDFGYHDDEAITALAQSIAELRKSRMHLPRDPPPETEKPTRPFGFLLQSDNVSLYTMTDNQSTRGSIVLKHQDGASVLDSALTSSEEDLSPAQKQKAGQPDSDVTLKADRTLTEISQELKFIDSAINALNTPEYEESSIREGKERQLQSPVSICTHVVAHVLRNSMSIRRERESEDERLLLRQKGCRFPLTFSSLTHVSAVALSIAVTDSEWYDGDRAHDGGDGEGAVR